jgi:hypothetical protein
LSLASGAGPACTAKANNLQAEEPGDRVRRSTVMQHEACDTAAPSTERVDLNRDGRPDMSIVRASGTEQCRSLDLNFDGHVDAWVYRGSDGQVRRRETDYDKDGRIDEVAHFERGHITARERAATLVGKVDTWHFYKDGKLERSERDANGDGYIDQWWEFPRAGQTDCPIVHMDANDDGRPDPAATLDLCPPAETPEPRPGPALPASAAVPSGTAVPSAAAVPAPSATPGAPAATAAPATAAPATSTPATPTPATVGEKQSQP